MLKLVSKPELYTYLRPELWQAHALFDESFSTVAALAYRQTSCASHSVQVPSKLAQGNDTTKATLTLPKSRIDPYMKGRAKETMSENTQLVTKAPDPSSVTSCVANLADPTVKHAFTLAAQENSEFRPPMQSPLPEEQLVPVAAADGHWVNCTRVVKRPE